MDSIFVKASKTSFMDNFWDFLGPPERSRLLSKNWASPLSLFYDYLTSSEKSETDEPILRSCFAYERTNGWRDERLTSRAKFIIYLLTGSVLIASNYYWTIHFVLTCIGSM